MAKTNLLLENFPALFEREKEKERIKEREREKKKLTKNLPLHENSCFDILNTFKFPVANTQAILQVKLYYQEKKNNLKFIQTIFNIV